ncbi:MAG TPA: DUF3147 family protein [Candidatus Dormibacteraeota bacterium]|nr:DUF3147 family protein [Candidatus Dormibacteraeota bacterium]
MKIHFNIAAIRQSKWHEHLVRFAFGGALTALTGIIAKEYGPAVGGLFLAFPAIFPASASLIEKHERQKKERHGVPAGKRGRDAAALDAAGAAMGASALILFGFVIWRYLPNHSTILVVGVSTLLWLVASVAIWRTCEAL